MDTGCRYGLNYLNLILLVQLELLFNKMSGNGNAVVLGVGVDGDGTSSTNRGAWTATTQQQQKMKCIRTYFCPTSILVLQNPGLALPLIALQYHEVKVKITFEALADLVVKGPVIIILWMLPLVLKSRLHLNYLLITFTLILMKDVDLLKFYVNT